LFLEGLRSKQVSEEVLGHIQEAFSTAVDVRDLQLIITSIAYFVHEGPDGMKKAQFMRAV
jgi:hypothetical protein